MKGPEDSLKFVLFVDGTLLLILASTMIIPMAVDAVTGNPDWQIFAGSAVATVTIGGLLFFSCRSAHRPKRARLGYLVTTSAWLFVSVFGSLPLLLCDLHLTFTDAFFETMSGLTTTGSTVIAGLDAQPYGLLLWRSLLQWFGGVGIVVMAIVLLPVLRTGGMQLFRTESSDISGKPVSRPMQMARITVIVYFGLTVLCAICYGFAGMNAFDAINHAMTTLATGGFSTKDASIGFYDSVPIEVVGTVFMLAGAMPLIWYARLLTERGRLARPEGKQVPVLLAVFAFATLAIAVWNMHYAEMNFPFALRMAVFNVASVLTDTGFANSDFASWGSFPVGIFFVLLLIGGCAGSTSGAIKIFRWQILSSSILTQLKLTIQPHRVLPVRYGHQAVEIQTVDAVRNFFALYIITLFVLSLLLMLTGVDFLSSISAVAQAMANAGPGLGEMGGPAGNFAGFPTFAKWVLILAMLLGRLEISTVYVLLLNDYWML
ncbi:MAG: TrkH family potassium uptake protein [Flavobacteriaceae bacterium]